ncbi:sensor histidine kinase [Spirosoma oryzicola]|uniref:sensor histidine kinase n=1 Tax=Spirosoma oryzicola TaxID=2898794 RepID=UPI001E618C59|nr:histidine kinase [Spirosoma oryzicola]UHG91201.1 histidine kinase [Spirosoma oryzicola]
MLKETSPLLVKYQNNWIGYALLTIVTGFIYVLLIHGSYWLYNVLASRRKVWTFVVFGLYAFVVYIFILAVVTILIFVHLGISMKDKAALQEALGGVFVTWVYTLLFIAVRAYRQNQRRERALILQKTQAELQTLKAQVNPHFMFNTLNNLYGSALAGDTDRTAAGIEQLSSVMRHMTEASQQDLIPIEQEVRFVEDTVELHRMRVPNTDTIQIRTRIDWDEKPAQIAPLLLNPLIENAFKYGISVQYPCFVRIQMQIENGNLDAVIENSLVPRTGLEKGTGLGLANVRQRLALVYPNRHSLEIREANDQFRVHLQIKL